MNIKKRIAISAVSLILAVAAAVLAVFAWPTRGDSVFNMQFSIAVVDMRLALYRVQDFDLDGAPDRNETGGWTNSSAIFDTGLTFSDAEIDEIVKSADAIANFLPTQVYTYRLDIYNSGDVDSFLNVDFGSIVDENGVEYSGIVEVEAYYFEGEGAEAFALSARRYITVGAPHESQYAAPVPLVLDAETVPSLSLYLGVRCLAAEANGAHLSNLNGYSATVTVTISA